MRPYSLRKDDKYMQPNLSGIQPSPLALLAATCSRIGATLHDDPVYTQKNISAFIGKPKDDFTYTKSCLEGSRASIFHTQEYQKNLAGYQQLQHQLQQQEDSCQQPTSQMYPSCMKIKHEDDFDYNHNVTEQTNEGMHICPSVVGDNRTTNIAKQCSHDDYNISSIPITCNSNSLSYSSNYDSSLVSQANSCFYQSNNINPNIQSSLSNASNIGTSVQMMSQSNLSTSVSGLQNTPKHYHTWEQQDTLKRSSSVTDDLKSSCMMYNSYDNTSPLQHYTSPPNIQQQVPQLRESRSSSLSHLPVSTELPTRHYSTPTPNPYATEIPSQASGFSPFPRYNTMIDEKPDTFSSNFQSQGGFQPPPHMPNTPHPLSPGPMNMMPPQQQIMNPSLSNTPIEVPPSFTNTYHPHPHVMVPPPNLNPAHPMANPALAEYQYQQQAFYAREYRRPRRIACTCPNCRDGENKTVTTKDGKQKKLHVCHVPGCGKIYGKTSHLRAHLRWHAGERPFACNWLFCNKRFTRSDELQRHRRTHTGDKRFECSVCLKKFMRSDHLSKHMKTHQANNNKNKDKNNDAKSNSNATNDSKSKTTVKKDKVNETKIVSTAESSQVTSTVLAAT